MLLIGLQWAMILLWSRGRSHVFEDRIRSFLAPTSKLDRDKCLKCLEEKCPKIGTELLSDAERGALCAICLLEVASCVDDEVTLVRRLPCTHLYHAECIDAWICESVSCPVCRKNPLLFRGKWTRRSSSRANTMNDILSTDLEAPPSLATAMVLSTLQPSSRRTSEISLPQALPPLLHRIALPPREMFWPAPSQLSSSVGSSWLPFEVALPSWLQHPSPLPHRHSSNRNDVQQLSPIDEERTPLAHNSPRLGCNARTSSGHGGELSPNIALANRTFTLPISRSPSERSSAGKPEGANAGLEYFLPHALPPTGETEHGSQSTSKV